MNLALSKPAFFELVRYEPHPGQVLVHRSRAPRRVLACGVRWGKTTAGAMEAVAALMAPCSESIGWVVGPTYQHADRIFERVVTIVERHLPHRVVERSAREHKLVIQNLAGGRSEVRGKSSDNPVQLLGEGLDWLIVDEAARLKPAIWEEHLSQRLIDKRGWALLLSTPRGCDWFYELFRSGQKQRDPDVESWASPSSANPHLDHAAIEAERKRLAPDVFAQEYEARFVGEREVCDTCGGPDPNAPWLHTYRGVGRPPKCAECGGYVDAEGKSIMPLDKNGKTYLKLILLPPLPSRAGAAAAQAG